MSLSSHSLLPICYPKSPSRYSSSSPFFPRSLGHADQEFVLGPSYRRQDSLSHATFKGGPRECRGCGILRLGGPTLENGERGNDQDMPVSTKKVIRSGAKVVTRHEMATIVDTHARRVLGVSGQVFISQWKAGKYRKLDSDSCPGVIELALLAPLPRRKNGRKKRMGSR